MTNIKSRKRVGFKTKSMHRAKEPHAFHYLSNKTSFWIAIISVFAFVTGNMIGQHGMYAFYHSVLGGFDDSLIVYDGTVSPVAKVPDFTKWSLYGGNSEIHTFRQVPADLLVSMPHYEPADERSADDKLANNLYSVDHFGTYATGGGEGAHPGVDIRLPLGTPIRNIANGHVVKVGEDKAGFGKYVLVRHPRVPDPDQPKRTITLYSLYAHLSVQLSFEGDIVQKGQVIGASGMTGNASGPHLHFQIQRDVCKDDGTVIGASAFWPFTWKDTQEAGVTFSQAIDQGLKRDHGLQCTVNPMLYVQANYPALEKPLVASGDSTSVSSAPARRATTRNSREDRIAARKSKIAVRVAVAQSQAASTSASSISSAVSQPLSAQPILVETQTLAYAEPLTATPAPSGSKVASVDIHFHGDFASRKWSKVTITLLDDNGQTVTDAGVLTQDLHLRTAYGKAEFKPAILSPMDFKNGQVEVQILPIGQQTVVVQVQPLNVLSKPVKPE
jgi:murein DD-endopeptidase MepM/ murein hydrolase activator NlpD